MSRRTMALVLLAGLLICLSPQSALAAGRQTVMVPMSDGVKLATDIYLPEGKGPFPVILARTPYGRTTDFTATIASVLGYVGVVQDMRGRFGSEGENLPFIGCGWVDLHDGADTVAWILKQEWCNGKVGTTGASAGGITQDLMAAAAPKGLAAQYIVVAAANLYTDAAYVGGALRKEQVEGWTESNKFSPKAMQAWRDHPAFDEYWQRFDSTSRHALMDAPAIHVGGWFDTFSQGTIDSFVGRQTQGAPGARGKQKLVMGPWTHGIGGGKAGDLAFRDARPPKQYDQVRWFNCLLKGEENGVLKEPAVAYYVMGDADDVKAPGNEWRYADAWPPPCTETPYYFHKAGVLGPERPSAAGPEAVEFTFDPADPCPTLGGRNLNIPAGSKDQRPIEARKDVVSFTADALAAPLEITGRVRAKVWVASSAVDTDLVVRLSDVYPDGRSMLMADGVLRLRYRQSLSAPEPMKPGELYEVEVDCWSTSLVVNTGHRVRVSVAGSNYPRFDLNPGTGKVGVEGGPFVKQTNRVFCDAAHPSRIILPVVKEAAAR